MERIIIGVNGDTGSVFVTKYDTVELSALERREFRF